jgi:diacylglycerol kinase (ATP)
MLEQFSVSGPRASVRIKKIFNRLRKTVLLRKSRRVVIILNPASGQGSIDLRSINRIFRQAEMDWDIEITQKFGDGARLAQKAIKEGASVVAAYGGDGTIVDVASGLLNNDVPMAIIPAGTGNAIAQELAIPFDISEACSLIANTQPFTRWVDIGKANNHPFMLRMGVGLEADITRSADRDFKNRVGALAYLAATVQAWNQAKISHYQLEIDQKIIEIDGLACMVANAATLGVPGLSISSSVRIDDGLLDVFVIRRADLAELTSLAASVIGNPALTASHLPHWQCRKLKILSTPDQGMEVDGEELGETPVNVKIIPSALRVIVPKGAVLNPA